VRPTFLRTSPRVAPGLMTRAAWQLLEDADRVICDDPATVAALVEQGLDAELVPDLASGVRTAEGARLVVVSSELPDNLVSDGPPTVAAYDAPGSAFVGLVAVMDRLRTECPWDREQTHRSLAKYLLEETYETLEAIDSGDDAHLQEELGDLLLQVAFHARIASERGAEGFDVDDVARGIAEKLVYRHPHVFAGLEVADADEVDRNWEALKAAEKQRSSPLDGIPAALPALAYADKVLGRLEKAGLLDVDGAGQDAGSSGDRLLDLVAQARAAGVDPEQELRDAVRRLITRASPD
jgi:XTP/dITP diphosphohydrolase